jgi:hypothetical protein
MDATAEGLTLAQVAGRPGVSTDTVRRRIKRGELTPGAMLAGLPELVQLVERLSELAGQLGFLQARVQKLQAQLEGPKATEPTAEPEAPSRPAQQRGRQFW